MAIKGLMITGCMTYTMLAISILYHSLFSMNLDQNLYTHTELWNIIAIVTGLAICLISPLAYILRKSSVCLKNFFIFLGICFFAIYLGFAFAADYYMSDYDYLKQSFQTEIEETYHSKRSYFERRFNCIGEEGCAYEIEEYIQEHFMNWVPGAWIFEICFLFSALLFFINAIQMTCGNVY